jgi:hypothetical protein
MSSRRVKDLFRPVLRRAHRHLVPARFGAYAHQGCAGYHFAATVAAVHGIPLPEPLKSFPEVESLDRAFCRVFEGLGIPHDPSLAASVIDMNDSGYPYQALKLIRKHVEAHLPAVAV